jgi:membrane carboxypeptidase/penicillin-binding protein
MTRVASGITGATPIWNKIMRGLLVEEESQTWEIPDGLKEVAICSITGTLPCNDCPTRLEWFLEETIPQKACTPELLTKEREKTKPEGRILEPAARTEF